MVLFVRQMALVAGKNRKMPTPELHRQLKPPVKLCAEEVGDVGQVFTLVAGPIGVTPEPSSTNKTNACAAPERPEKDPKDWRPRNPGLQGGRDTD